MTSSITSHFFLHTGMQLTEVVVDTLEVFKLAFKVSLGIAS